MVRDFCKHLLPLLTLVSVCRCCILLLNGWKPLGLERRAQLAQIVVSTRTLSKSPINGHKVLYAANFEVISILKGWNILDDLQRKRSKSVRETDRLFISVSGFGDRRFCFSSVDVGETYILFLAYKNETDTLVAKYDDIYGASELLYGNNEETILLSLGWRPWSSWTGCTQGCGSGVRRRRRQCFFESCVGPPQEIRECNTFQCKGSYDVLTYVQKEHSNTKLRHLFHQGIFNSIDTQLAPNAPTYLLFKNEFPKMFSLLVTFKGAIKTPQYVITIYDSNSRMLFGLKLDATELSFYYSKGNALFNERNKKTFPASFKQPSWYQIGISVTDKDLVITSQCSKIGNATLDQHLTDQFDIFGRMYIGADENEGPSRYFKGKLSQLAVVADPSAVWRQCGKRVSFYPAYKPENDEGSAQERTHTEPISEGEDSDDGSGRELTDDRESYEGSGEVKCDNCLNGGTCQSGNKCLCAPGWTGSHCGQACNLHIYEQCNCSGAAVLKVNRKTMECTSQMLRGPTKHPICSSSCQNGGFCIEPNKCRCQDGFKGNLCEKAFCKPSCLNNGICTVKRKCRCPKSFFGPRCEHMVCLKYKVVRISYLRPAVKAYVQDSQVPCGILGVFKCSTKSSHYIKLLFYTSSCKLIIQKTRLDLECYNSASNEHYVTRIPDNKDRIET